jgi:ATP-binding cassette subfamily C protein CydC
VTHRLAALAAADEVILLGPLPQHDRTRTGPDRAPAGILARGTHAQLLAGVPEYRWAAEQDRVPATGRLASPSTERPT